MKNELNSRQWALYNYLKDKGDEWTCQWQIALEIPEYKYDGKQDAALFHDSTARKQMTADIRTINDSSIIQKVIISSAKGIKIANSEEFDLHTRKDIMAAVRRLMRAKRKAEKGNRDGQMRLVFNSERDTVKAFIDSDKDFGARLKASRQLSGWTLKQAASYLKSNGDSTDEPLLSKFENGYCFPKKTTLSKLCDMYGVSVDYLLTGDLSDEAGTNENDALQDVMGG